MSELTPGKYQHYKGGLYEVITLGILEATLEKVVIYKSLHDADAFKAGTVWVRPYEEFVKDVVVDGEKVPRFRLIETL